MFLFFFPFCPYLYYYSIIYLGGFMKKIVILIWLVMIPSFCFAGEKTEQLLKELRDSNRTNPFGNNGSTQDFRNGNSYNSNQDVFGNTNVRGFNYNTGSAWNTTIEPDGDMRGIDSDGNPWNYNKGTGSYINSGTGTVCIGRGVARVCQ